MIEKYLLYLQPVFVEIVNFFERLLSSHQFAELIFSRFSVNSSTVSNFAIASKDAKTSILMSEQSFALFVNQYSHDCSR